MHGAKRWTRIQQMQNSKPASRVVNEGHLRGVRPDGSEIRRPLLSNAFPNSEQVPTTSPSIGTELPPHLQRTRSSPATTMVPVKPLSATKRTRMSPVPSRKASRGEDKTKDAVRSVGADSASQFRLQRKDSTPTRRQFPISDSPMELLEGRPSDEAELGSECYLAFMKLRVFLVEKMLDALNHNPDGGFGIRLDDVEEEFKANIDSSDYASLMEISNGLEDLIASMCSDLVELKQLIVGRVGIMGCVPATGFCKDPKKFESEVKAKLQLVQTKCNSAKQDSYQDSSMSRVLISKIKDLLKSTVQEILSGQRTFLTIEAFEELFAKKYGSKLDPKTAGFDSVLELLKGLKMEDLINLISNDGMVYMVPSNQVFTQHQQDKRTDQSQKSNTVNKTAIQQQKKGKDQSKKDSIATQAPVQQQDKRKSQSPKNSTAIKASIQLQKKGKEPSRKDSTVNQTPIQQQDKGNNQSRKDSTLNKTLNQQQDNRNDQSRKDSTVNQVPVQQQDIRNDHSRKENTVNQASVQQQEVAAAQHSVPPPPPIPEPQSGTTVDNRTGQISERRERIEVKLQTQDTAPQFVDLLNEDEPVFRSVDMAEFDEVILNKLRNLFTTVIINGGQNIALYRLPMHFLNHTGSILDYKKYGFIELADVVALLQDIVHVVDTAKGKVIAAVPKHRRRITQSISTEQGLQRVDHPIRSRTSVPTHQLLPFTQMTGSVPQLPGLAQPTSPIGGGGGGVLRRDLDAPIQGFLQADGPVAYQQFPVQHNPGALNAPQQELVMNRLPAQQLFQHSFNGLNNRTQQRPF